MHPAYGPSRRQARRARSPTRWPTTAETPSWRIETPYSASAISIVRFWCVMTMSWLLSRSSLEDAEQAPEVRVVERGLDLVEDVERARARLEDRDQQGDRGERALPAGEQREPLDLLADRAHRHLDARRERIVGVR